MLISTRCMHGFMSNLIKKSWTDSTAEASLCQFFENWWMKLKCQNLPKPLGTIIQQNYWSLYLSEPFSFVHFNMIHAVVHSLTVAWICHWIKSWLYLPMCTVAMRLSRSEAGSSFLFGVSSHRSRNGLFAWKWRMHVLRISNLPN